MVKQEEKEEFIKKVFQEIGWEEEGDFTNKEGKVIASKKKSTSKNALTDSYLNNSSELWQEWKDYILKVRRGKEDEFIARKLKILEKIVWGFTKNGANLLDEEQKKAIFGNTQFTGIQDEEIMWRIMDLVGELAPFLKKVEGNLGVERQRIINNYRDGDEKSKQAYQVVNVRGLVEKLMERDLVCEIGDHSTLKEDLRIANGRIEELEDENDKLKKNQGGTGTGVNQNQKEIDDLKRDAAEDRQIIIDLNRENQRLRDENAALKSAPQGQQQNIDINELIGRARNAKTIVELEGVINALNSYRNSENEDFKVIYQQRKQEIDQLIDLLDAKLEANKQIEKELSEGYQLSQEDIIPKYQEHAEKIRDLTDRQAVEDFAKEMVDYLRRQKAAHQSLNDSLENAKDVSNSDKDKEGDIFEKRHKARQNLDILTEDASLEAKLAYQIMNKDSEVANSVEKLANQLLEHLKGYEARANEPVNAKFLQALNSRGYTEGTEKYKLYWILQGIAKEFAKSCLKKEIDVYPYVTVKGTNGHTSWRDRGDGFADLSGFDLHLNFDRRDLLNSGGLPAYSTLSHELSHDVVNLKQVKGLLPGEQFHSKAFWKGFRVSNDSTLTYLISCLSSEKRQELKDYVINPSVRNQDQNRFIYFPNTDFDQVKEGSERKKKSLTKPEEVVGVWDSAWKKVFDLVDDSMNRDLSNWRSSSEKKKHWVKLWIKQPWETKNANYKIYIYYSEAMPEGIKSSIDSMFGSGDGWWKESISAEKTRKLCDRLCSSVGVECGIQEENQQKAQIIDNPPPTFPKQ